MALLAGRRGLVFGVANSKSLAWATAKAWKTNGAQVAIAVQGARFAEKVRTMLQAEPGWSPEDTLVVECDVDCDASMQQAAAAVGAYFHGELDMVLHGVAFAPRECLYGAASAGSTGADVGGGFGGVFTNTPRVGFAATMMTSAFSLVAIAREFGPLLAAGAAARKAPSSVTALTFDGSRRAVPGYNVMGPAKAALETSARYLAVELGPHDIRVNAISAGPVNTLAARGIPGFVSLRREAEQRSPLQRPLEAADVADASVYLASDLARAVTGHTLFVDGGYSVVGP